MNDIETRYRQSLADGQEKKMRDFENAPDPFPQGTSEPSAGEGPLGPPSPTTGQKIKSVVGAGATATKETAMQGFTHFANGLKNTWEAAGKEGVGTRALGIISGEAEGALGAMTVLMALPVGIGVSMKRAMEAFAPGRAGSIALPGEAAAPLRSFVGGIGLLADPKMRKLAFGNSTELTSEERAQREALVEEMSKPMTYGELFEIVTMIIAPGAIIKGGKIAKRRYDGPPPPLGGGEPPGPPLGPGTPEVARAARRVAAEESFAKTQLSFAPDPLDRPTPITDPLRVQRVAKSSEVPSETSGMTMSPEDLATSLKIVSEELHGGEVAKGPGKSKAAPTEPTAPAEPAKPTTEKPAPYEEPVSPTEYPEYTKQLSTAIEQGATVAEEIITAELQGVEALIPETAPKTTKGGVTIVSRQPLEVSAQVTKIEKQIRAEERRRDRGIKVDEPAEVQDAERVLKLLKEDLTKAQQKVGDQPLSDKFISKQEKSLEAAEIEMKRLKETGKSRMFDESGRIDPGLLARMAVGAAIGGTQGDTPEERVAFALAGMFGGVLAGKLARAMVTRFKTDPKLKSLLDTSNPKMPGNAPLVDPTLGTQKVVTSLSGDQKALVNKLLTREEETIFSPEELRAGKQIEMKVWERVKELVDDIVAKGSVAVPGELRDTLALARTLASNNKLGKHWGGATGAQGSARVKVATREINKLAREWDASTSEMTIARALHAAESIEQVSTMGRLYYAVPEALTQAYMGGLLLSKAIVKNLVGNATMIPISMVDRSLAAVNPAAWMRGDVRPGITEGFRAIGPVMESIIEQFRMIKHWDALGKQAEQMGATHVEIMPRGIEAISGMLEESGASMMSKAVEWVGNAANFGPEVMRRTDGSSKAIATRQQIHYEAMQQAGVEAKTTAEFWQKYDHYKKNYNELSEPALVRIKQFADHQTFTTPFESELMRAIQMGPTDPWLQLGYRIAILPFVRTGVRLMEIGAEYTPILNGLAANARKQWRAGGTERAIVEARMGTGSLMLGGAAWLAMQGLVTGNMPAHPKDVTMEHAGRPTRSIWDPLAEKWRSYDGLGLVTQAISTGADFAYQLGQLSEADAEHLVTAGALAFSNNVDANQFMQAIGQFYDIATNGSTDAQYEKLLQFARLRAQSLIPAVLSEFLGGSEKQRVMPPLSDDKSPSGAIYRELQTLMNTLKMKTGGSDEKTIKKTRNMFTGDVIPDTTWPFSPFGTKDFQDEPWAAELRRLNGAGLKPLTGWLGNKDPADIGMTEKPAAPGVQLTASELDRWEVLMTQEVKNSHGYLTDALNNLVQSPSYLRQTEFDKQTRIHGVWLEFKERAELRLLKEIPELDVAMKLKRGQTMIERHVAPERQPAARERLGQRYGVPSPGAAP